MNLSDKEKQGKEMRLSAIIIILIAIIAIVFLILEQLNVTNLLDNYNKIPLFIITVFFLIMGFLSIGTAKRTIAKGEIENKNIEKIMNWFSDNVSQDTVPSSLLGDNDDNELYIKRLSFVNSLIVQNFPDVKDLPSSLDEVIVDKIFN